MNLIKMLRLLVWIVTVAALVVVAAGPFVLGRFEAGLLAEILIWSILAMGLNLIFGYTGMLSFGQALFFGLGAYGMGFSVLYFNLPFFVALLAAVLFAAIGACITGFFAVRLTWHYFAIITIIFSLVVYFVALGRSDWTGGEDGLSFELPPLLRLGGFELSLYEPIVEYYFVLLLTAVAFFVLMKVTQSELGLVFRAVRDNIDRVGLLGYNTFQYRWLAFIIAGAFGGLAGALFAVKTRYASATYLYWPVSGDAVIWTVVGGTGTLAGPLVGTALLVTLRDYISAWFEHYLLVVGAIAVVVAVFAPKGIVGILRDKVIRS